MTNSQENFCMFSLQDIINVNDLNLNTESAEYCKYVLNTSIDQTLDKWL